MAKNITLEWGGGAEILFGNKKKESVKWTNGNSNERDTIKQLLVWLKNESKLVTTDKPELFFCGDSVRPGIIVLINEEDWELHDQLDYEFHDGDTICFISTLHGG